MSETMTPLADLEYQSISLRPWWASNGIIDARAFRIGNNDKVHALSHAKPNLVRGACGVTAPVIEAREPYLASWADADVDCAACIRARA